MINIRYVKAYSDDTWEYIVTTDCKTVRDFISEWLEECPKEWGYFHVKLPDISFLDWPRCEYRYGKIIDKNFNTEYLNKNIIQVSGSGGWSCSDFYFMVS